MLALPPPPESGDGGVCCNCRPTIPHRFKDDLRLGDTSTDTQRDLDSGSRLYEVNIWMWRYGRGRAQMVSIAEEEKTLSECLSKSRIREASQRGSCRCSAAAGAVEGGGRAY
jgi:hypothetical protein